MVVDTSTSKFVLLDFCVKLHLDILGAVIEILTTIVYLVLITVSAIENISLPNMPGLFGYNIMSLIMLLSARLASTVCRGLLLTFVRLAE